MRRTLATRPSICSLITSLRTSPKSAWYVTKNDLIGVTQKLIFPCGGGLCPLLSKVVKRCGPRWARRTQAICPSIYQSIYLSICLCISIDIYLYVYRCILSLITSPRTSPNIAWYHLFPPIRWTTDLASKVNLSSAINFPEHMWCRYGHVTQISDIWANQRRVLHLTHHAGLHKRLLEVIFKGFGGNPVLFVVKSCPALPKRLQARP